MVICFGCSTISVSSDHNTKSHFTNLKSFDFIPVQDQSNIKLIQEAVRNQLESKGYTQSTDNPDFQISIHLSTQEKTRIKDITYSNYDNSFGRRINWGDSTDTPRIDVYEYEEGMLILDFTDAQLKELSWRGVARAKVQHYTNPEKHEKRINKAVRKLLKNFPPSKG